MAVTLKFHFNPNLITTQGPQIVAGATGIPGVITRLPQNYLEETTTLIAGIPGLRSSQKLQTGSTGTLTQAQNAALQIVNDWIHKARETAKKAFAGQDVKLHSEFQIGVNKPVDLPSVKARALIVQKSCADMGNSAALQTKGWTAKDTTDFATAIDGLGTSDDTQEESKIDRGGDTDVLHTAYNNSYDRLLVIQNAGELELPAQYTANTPLRAKLLLGVFPPAQKKTINTVTPPTPPVPSHLGAGFGDARAVGVWTYAGIHNGVPYFQTAGGLYVFASAGTGGQFIMAETLDDMAPALYTPLGGDPGFVGPWGVNSGTAPGGTVS